VRRMNSALRISRFGKRRLDSVCGAAGGESGREERNMPSVNTLLRSPDAQLSFLISCFRTYAPSVRLLSRNDRGSKNQSVCCFQ
jgi:hypothetical protein